MEEHAARNMEEQYQEEKHDNRGRQDNRHDSRNRQDNRRQNRGGGGGDSGMNMGMSMGNMDARNFRKDFVKERLAMFSGPTTNIQSKEGGGVKKFTGRCRLFIGNLPNTITDEDFRKMFEQFGEIAEVILRKDRGFGFVKLDTRHNAEAAKTALDGTMKDGRSIRVRFATDETTLKVKHLSPWVSNELLEAAFSAFGDVERAVVIVDDRGRSVGEGIVEFSRKQSAQMALRRCAEECFLLTSSPRPVLVQPLDQKDDIEGLPEKNMQKFNKQYLKEREVGPRLAEPGTFEYEFSNRYKKLYELEQQKRDYLEKEIEEGRRALEDQMQFAIYEHEANLLRERLRQMEEQTSVIQQKRKLRHEEEMRREEALRQQEMLLRQQQEDILRIDLRRRQEEENLMMQEYLQMQGMGGDHMGNQAASGANGMMQEHGMKMPPRQSRFDQPPMGPGYIPGAEQMSEMGGPPLPAGGLGDSMLGNHDVHGGDMKEEYPIDSKRRRY